MSAPRQLELEAGLEWLQKGLEPAVISGHDPHVMAVETLKQTLKAEQNYSRGGRNLNRGFVEIDDENFKQGLIAKLESVSLVSLTEGPGWNATGEFVVQLGPTGAQQSFNLSDVLAEEETLDDLKMNHFFTLRKFTELSQTFGKYQIHILQI